MSTKGMRLHWAYAQSLGDYYHSAIKNISECCFEGWCLIQECVCVCTSALSALYWAWRLTVGPGILSSICLTFKLPQSALDKALQLRWIKKKKSTKDLLFHRREMATHCTKWDFDFTLTDVFKAPNKRQDHLTSLCELVSTGYAITDMLEDCFISLDLIGAPWVKKQPTPLCLTPVKLKTDFISLIMKDATNKQVNAIRSNSTTPDVFVVPLKLYYKRRQMRSHVFAWSN